MNDIQLFNKVLVANRGEIACRIIRTLNKLDIDSVAVYSDADRSAQYVLQADESYWIGASPASESYLDMHKIIEVAKRCGADAIHPGYGFLSENASFAQLCMDSGVALIGPPASAMVAMGSKSEAKKLMEEAQVPLVPGYHGDDQYPQHLFEHARAIGFPVLLKAALGGGGKGMRLVEHEGDFLSALESCQREAQSAFGDAHILIEKYITQPRHVEIQIFIDTHGNAVYLFERDCSIQRRHQKVIEEAPAPGMSAELRNNMGDAAVRAAKAIGYVGAGTIEFLLAADGQFYFMEMNTRLQVEHPVTEMITGQDLVEWQIRVAEGGVLPLTQQALSINGHAIEVRIYAEDPANQFLPSTGVLRYLALPSESQHVRVDAGVVCGDEISVFYDPMIVKLIVWDQTRQHAIHRMQKALTQFHLSGVKTNIAFLSSLLAHADFESGKITTHFIDDNQGDLAFEPVMVTEKDYIAAALFQFLDAGESTLESSAWKALQGWHLNDKRSRAYLFGDRENIVELILEVRADDVCIQLFGKEYQLQVRKYNNELIVSGQVSFRCSVVQVDAQISVFRDANVFHITNYQYQLLNDSVSSEANLRAPMNGRVVQVSVCKGDEVEEGDLLVTVEAMKMEHAIRSQKAGRIANVFFAEGDLVSEGDELLEIESVKED